MSDQKTTAADDPIRAPEFTDPFEWDEVEYRLASTGEFEGKPRGQAAAYITARAVMRRLDAVCDARGWRWSDRYRREPFDENHVECTITIHYPDGSRLSRSDVGEGHAGDGSDADPIKTAYSDALKRAAVHWGIGRDLYGLPKTWVAIEVKGRSKTIADGEWERLEKVYRATVNGQRPARGQRGSGGGGGTRGTAGRLSLPVLPPRPRGPSLVRGAEEREKDR